MDKLSNILEFDTLGKLRIVRASDGLYVIGRGFLIPVMDFEEGADVIVQLRPQLKGKNKVV